MPPLNVLISGGGIAGNALAFWLSKLGHKVTVVEWFPSLRATGLQLDLRGHGVEVMKRMGLEQTFREYAAPEQGFQVVDCAGKRRAYFGVNKTGKGVQTFSTEHEIMRGDLCLMMYEQCKDNLTYKFGTSIASFKEVEDEVQVFFANGQAEHYDLLVGADGQGSHVRKLMLGPTAPKTLIPLGGYIGYLRIQRPIAKGEEYIATWYLATNNRFMMTRRNSSTEMQAYLICTSDTKPVVEAYRHGIKAEKAAFTEVFNDAGWCAKDLMAELRNSGDFYCERVAIVKTDSWSQGSVALVGDAAYCPSVMTGMGTSSAMVGAYVLAGEISQHCKINDAAADRKTNLDAALASYEKKFRPFMDQVQRGLQEGSWGYWPTSPFGIAVVNRLAGIASALKLDVVARMISREKVSGWELPSYEEMIARAST